MKGAYRVKLRYDPKVYHEGSIPHRIRGVFLCVIRGFRVIGQKWVRGLQDKNGL